MISLLKRNREEKNPIFLKDLTSRFSRNFQHYGSVITPVVSFEKWYPDYADAEFLGFTNDLFCYQQCEFNGKQKLELFKYNQQSNTLQVHRSINIPETVRFFRHILFTPSLEFGLIFSQDRLAMKISILGFDNNSESSSLHENVLTLPECNTDQNQNSKSCLSFNNELLATVRPSSRTTYSSVHVSLVALSKYRNLDDHQNLNLKLLEHKEIPVALNSKLLDCELVSNGDKLILVFDSPSTGKLFVCCSTQPLRKLYHTKIVCNYLGWFFVRDLNGSNDLLLTVSNRKNDEAIQMFSFIDNRTLILMNEFNLSSLDIEVLLSDNFFVCISNKTLFVIRNSTCFVVEYSPQVFVKYKIQLTELKPGQLNSVTVEYNGYEVIISRQMDYCSENYYAETIHIDVFFMPLLDSLSLFGLSRLAVLKAYSTDFIKSLAIPNKIKTELISFKS